MSKDRVIQISIARPVEKGSNEQAKMFNFSFEGSLTEFEVLQKGIDTVIQKILWDKAPQDKPVEKKQAV